LGKTACPQQSKKSTYVGNHMEYTVETEFGAVFAISENVQAPFATGQQVGLGFARSGPVLLPPD